MSDRNLEQQPTPFNFNAILDEVKDRFEAFQPPSDDDADNSEAWSAGGYLSIGRDVLTQHLPENDKTAAVSAITNMMEQFDRVPGSYESNGISRQPTWASHHKLWTWTEVARAMAIDAIQDEMPRRYPDIAVESIHREIGVPFDEDGARRELREMER